MGYVEKLAAVTGEQEKEAAGPAQGAVQRSLAVITRKGTEAKKRMFAGVTTAKGTRAGGSPGFLARLKKGVGEATGFGGGKAEHYAGLKSQAGKARATVAREKGKGVRNVGGLRKAERQSASQQKALAAFKGSREGKRMIARRQLTVGAGVAGAGYLATRKKKEKK